MSERRRPTDSYEKRHWEKSYWNIPDGWDFLPLGSLFSPRKERSSNTSSYPLYSLTVEDGITRKTERYERSFLLKDEENNEFAVVRPGDFVFNPMNLRFGAIAYSREPSTVLVSGYYDVLVPDRSKIDSHFTESLLRSPWVLNLYDRIAIGSLVEKRRIHLSIFERTSIPLPPLEEQQKIAAILSKWDEAIVATQQLAAVKRRMKDALLQELISEQFRSDSDSRTTKLSSVLRKVNDPITVQPNESYREIGIRSHGKGIFHKEPVTGATLGEKRVFRVHPNCFVFNVVFAWEQAVAKTTDTECGMIASHRFPMFKPVKELLDLDFLLYFFKTSRGKNLLGLASPGGAGRNRTLSQAAFLKTSIPLPQIKKQRAIAEVLSTIDNECECLNQKVSLLSKERMGLIHQLLTGKVRVNVDTETVKG